MAKKTGVVFENKDLVVAVVDGGSTSSMLLIRGKASRGLAKVIPNKDGLVIFAEEGDMTVMSDRVRPGVKITRPSKPR